MSKMRLEMDALRVESFSTLPEQPAASGTVEAYATGFDGDTCFGPSCRRCPSAACPTNAGATCETCAATCGATCPNTCAYTCDDASCGVSYCNDCTTSGTGTGTGTGTTEPTIQA